MGERLVINLNNDHQETIACVYYHWSNFTDDALQELKELKAMLPDDPGKLSTDELREKLIVGYLNKSETNFLGGIDHGEVDGADAERAKKLFLNFPWNDFLGGIDHGGVDGADAERAKKLFPNIPWNDFDDGRTNRSIGLVGFDDESINRMNEFAEGTIYWNIDTGMIENTVFYYADNECDPQDFRRVLNVYNVELKDVPVCPVDIEHFHISELEKLQTFVEKHHFYKCGDVRYISEF